MTCWKAASASAGRPSSPAGPPGMSLATELSPRSTISSRRDAGRISRRRSGSEDRCGDGEHEQRQHAELEQETVQLLVRLRLLKLRGHDQNPPDSGDQPDEQERLSRDLVLQEVGTQGVGQFSNDEDEQRALQHEHTTL